MGGYGRLLLVLKKAHGPMEYLQIILINDYITIHSEFDLKIPLHFCWNKEVVRSSYET